MKDNIKRLRKHLQSPKGSAAIVLSLLVSASVAGTIFVTQQNAVNFISSKQKDVNSDAFSPKYALILGSYLVSNNLILCRQGGWEGEGDRKCKWNDGQAKLTDFRLSNVKNGEKLQFAGTVTMSGSQTGGQEFELTFNLVNWKDSHIKGLIGEIPRAVCRDSSTLQVISDYVCDVPSAPSTRCKDAEGGLVENTICEYISRVDQDYWIVLINVKIPSQSDAQADQIVYAGVRRPLTSFVVEVTSRPKCELSCASSSGANLYPGCRGDDQLAQGSSVDSQGDAPLELTITNRGPGAMYDLSLLRSELPKEGSSDKKTYSVKANILSDNNREVLLVGESITVQDTVDCTHSLEYIRRSGGGGVSVNTHASDMVKVSYLMDRLDGGHCVKDNQMVVGGVLTKSCSPDNADQTCENEAGETGTCLYTNIEPKRIFIPADANATVATSFEQVVIRFIPAH